jgi:hypothetical protein
MSLTKAGELKLGGDIVSNPNSIASFTSTTRGIVLPTLSRTQFRSITGSASSVAVALPGSGYTTGSYTAISTTTNGAGSGLVLTATVSGGVVTATGIYGTGSGGGYHVGDTIYAAIFGGGSGFTAIITALASNQKGMAALNTTTGGLVSYNGTNVIGDYITSSASALTLEYGTDYSFTGTTATYTLPVPSATVLTRQNAILITNLGSGDITINSATGSQVVDIGTTTATSTITLASGTSTMLLPTGTAFKALYKQ